jgi:hypothetical protein
LGKLPQGTFAWNQKGIEKEKHAKQKEKYKQREWNMKVKHCACSMLFLKHKMCGHGKSSNHPTGSQVEGRERKALCSVLGSLIM